MHYSFPSLQIAQAAVSEYSNAQTITNVNKCPPWFVFSNISAERGSSPCKCLEDFGEVVTCDQNLQESYLLLHYCMTYNSSSSDAISFGSCPYAHYSNIVKHKYIALPHNVSDLNEVFCAPLNRDGQLCKDCIDGFGPSIISIDYACANCTENNYG